MQNSRLRKINSLIREQFARVIFEECDWARPLALAVTQVDTAPDLSHSRVKVSLLGDEVTRLQALGKLTGQASHLRYVLAQRIEIRKMPFIKFELDDSISQGEKVVKLIDSLDVPVDTDDTSEK
ncbi:MAG TPA: 30S ribosome-binding factor RbfA [bacterium]|nr:30S ribosome-binding factor RbfA [bacterium]